jgi:hypothetical protein
LAVAFATAILGLGAAACTSSSQAATAAAAGTHTQGAAQKAVPAAVPSETEIYPSAPETLSASDAGCAPKALVKDLRVTSVAEVDGVVRLSGYVQSLECGPGVPDDVQYTDAGSVQTFAAASTATYTLRGSDPAKDYAVSAATFMDVADGTSTGKGDLGWDRGICELHLDQSGRVISVEGVYTP